MPNWLKVVLYVVLYGPGWIACGWNLWEWWQARPVKMADGEYSIFPRRVVNYSLRTGTSVVGSKDGWLEMSDGVFLRGIR